MKLSFFFFHNFLNHGRPKVPNDLYLAFFGSKEKLLDHTVNFILEYGNVNQGGKKKPNKPTPKRDSELH